MINIEGKTQAQIEEMFSKEKMNEYIAIELSSFLDKLDTSYYTRLQNVAGTSEDETVGLMMHIIALFGNVKNGLALDKDYPHVREFDINQQVLGISSYLGDVVPTKYEVAMDIIGEFDGILWDIQQENVQNDLGQWYTRSYSIIDYAVAESASTLLQYSRYKLPLIEQPLDWNEGESGGYHLNNGKSTLNLGEAKQPQKVLDVLNRLQKQAYTLRTPDFKQQHAYTLEQIKKKNWKKAESENLEAVEIKLQTAQETYQTMEGREFYFEWKDDMRGRGYCSGYDITLQGDSYQKSLLRPVFK